MFKLIKENLLIELFCVFSFATIASICGAIIEGIYDKPLSDNILENFATYHNALLNFKFAPVGALIGVFGGLAVILIIKKLSDTSIGKKWMEFVDNKNDEKLFF